MAPNLPVILCFHGYGSSGAIFNAQARRIQASLRRKFRFVFLDGESICPPGPGVSQVFGDSGPFYSWFDCDSDSEDRASINANLSGVDKAVQKKLFAKGVCSADVVGVLGFSQGCMVATYLLMQAQHGNMQWSNVRFGAFFCGACADDIVDGQTEVQLPSLHVHGLDDAYLDRSRMLTTMFNEQKAEIFEFDGDHRMPTSKTDNDSLAAKIECLSKMERKLVY